MVNSWSRIVTIPGKPGNIKEFENGSEKSENLKTDQKIREKLEDFILPFEWQP